MPRMTLNKLASEIAKREGKKSQARIGDIREILKIICTIEAEDMVANPDADPLVIGAMESHISRIQDRLLKKAAKKK